MNVDGTSNQVPSSAPAQNTSETHESQKPAAVSAGQTGTASDAPPDSSGIHQVASQVGNVSQSSVQAVPTQNSLNEVVELNRFRASYGGVVSAQTPAAAAQPTGKIRQDVVDDRVQGALSWGGTNLSYTLQDPDLTTEEKRAVIDGVINSDHPESALLQFDANQGVRNLVYDQQRTVAAGIGDAYRAGVVTDTELHDLAAKLGPELTEQLVLGLSADPANVEKGGAVEALGEEAESLGYTRAAALAFTSSEQLMYEHLPASADQRNAFSEVRSFIETLDEEDERANLYGESAYDRSLLTLGLTNAARLTATGDGYSDAEFDRLLGGLGASAANEAIARASVVPGDDTYLSALDELGSASERIASGLSGDDQKDWQLNADIAFTQSSTLINKNLTTQETIATFDRLNQRLVDLRDDAKDAAGQYRLLQQPTVIDSLATLIETRGDQILEAKLSTPNDYEGQADLAQFFESTLFSPYTDAGLRDRIGNAVNGYIEDEFRGAGVNSSGAGRNVGELLGTLQVAARRGIAASREGEERSTVETFTDGFIPRALGVGAGVLLSTVTGPLGAGLGNEVVKQVFTQLFNADDVPADPQQLQEAFIREMQRRGVDLNFGEQGIDTYNQLQDVALASLNRLIAAERDPETRRSLEEARALLMQLNGAVNDGFQNTSDSGQLSQELDERE